MNKKYYDGGIVTEILFTHLEPEKMLEVLTAFAEAKGVDAVEVIRCKDCKHHTQTERNGFVYWSQCNHPHWDLSQGCQLAEVDDTDFCSWAERKDDEID